MKLTIEHLKGYLGTGAVCVSKEGYYKNYVINSGNGLGGLEHLMNSDVYKLALYPLSSLTEHREDLGFIPMERIKKDYIGETIGLNTATWSNRVVQKLQGWHIDIHNLIENNLAIDKRTL